MDIREGCLDEATFRQDPRQVMLGCGSSIDLGSCGVCCAPGHLRPPLPWLQGASEPPLQSTLECLRPPLTILPRLPQAPPPSSPGCLGPPPYHPLHDDDLGPQRLADGEDVHEPQAEHGEVQGEDDAPGVQQRGHESAREQGLSWQPRAWPQPPAQLPQPRVQPDRDQGLSWPPQAWPQPPAQLPRPRVQPDGDQGLSWLPRAWPQPQCDPRPQSTKTGCKFRGRASRRAWKPSLRQRSWASWAPWEAAGWPSPSCS